MPTCHSTNDIALQMVRNTDTTEGTVIITDHQLQGRGQRGNEWLTRSGENITMSIILKPRFIQASNQYFLNMAVSQAVHSTVKHFLKNQETLIKWPNDILVDRKKIAGILIENGLSGRNLDYSVVGIGLNVNQSDFSLPSATSLKLASRDNINLNSVFEKLVENLEVSYLKLKANRFSELKADYLSSLIGYRTKLTFRSEYEFEGVIEDVEDSGLLRVNIEGISKPFDFKEIEFIL